MQFVADTKQNAASLTETVRRATWTMRDGWVTGNLWVDIGSAGTGNTELKVTVSPTGTDQFLPQPKDSFAGVCIGMFEYLDASANRYVGTVNWDGTDLKFRVNASSTASAFGQAPNFAAASGDSLSLSFTYEAA